MAPCQYALMKMDCCSLYFYKTGDQGHSDLDKKSCFSGFLGRPHALLLAIGRAKSSAPWPLCRAWGSHTFSVMWLRTLDFWILIWVWAPEVIAIPAPPARDCKGPAVLSRYTCPPKPFKPICLTLCSNSYRYMPTGSPENAEHAEPSTVMRDQ